MNANTETTCKPGTLELSPAEKVQAWIDKYRATLDVKFIPWSQSRNKGEKNPSLNFEVTISREGLHAEMTTDYGMGYGSCEAYKELPAKSRMGNMLAIEYNRIKRECEKGAVTNYRKGVRPTFADVLYSLTSDYSVLDSPGYEAWANEFGYDEDSRKGEQVYRACLEIALKMRAMFGDTEMKELAEACQDY